MSWVSLVSLSFPLSLPLSFLLSFSLSLCDDFGSGESLLLSRFSVSVSLDVELNDGIADASDERYEELAGPWGDCRSYE